MSGEGEVAPTHRIHWRASSDARVSGRTYGRLDHAGRVKQAGYCWDGGLIADRCYFGPRRVRLEGEYDYAPRHSYHEPAPTAAGHETALAVLEWTLGMLYEMPRTFGRAVNQERLTRNATIEVRVREMAI